MLTTPLHHWTPTLESLPLQQRTGKKIWLKMECYQPSGSFKIRGIGRLCQHWAGLGKKHFVASSGGNAGVAVAYAGRQLGIPTTVFLPTTSKAIFIDAIKAEGAEVKIQGDVWDEANEAALQFVKQVNGAYVPPFDDPLIWAGHATMIDEIAALGLQPDAVIAAVGGGGLACGILQGMQQNGWDNVPLLGVETEGAASFAAAIKANKLVTLDKITTLATSLGAKRIAQRLFDWRLERPLFPITVSDKSAVLACQSFADDHRVLIEPSSGAALSAVYESHEELAPYNNILVIVCGGIGISLALLEEYLQKTAK